MGIYNNSIMDDDFYFFNEFEDALDPTDDDDQYNY